MKIVCPGCQRQYRIPDEKLPKKPATAKCKSCGNRISIPAKSAGVPVSDGKPSVQLKKKSPSVENRSVPSPKPLPDKRKPRQKKVSSRPGHTENRKTKRPQRAESLKTTCPNCGEKQILSPSLLASKIKSVPCTVCGKPIPLRDHSREKDRVEVSCEECGYRSKITPDVLLTPFGCPRCGRPFGNTTSEALISKKEALRRKTEPEPDPAKIPGARVVGFIVLVLIVVIGFSYSGYHISKALMATSASSGNINIPKGEPGAEYSNNVGMSFVFIPPGSFMMGSPPDESGRLPDEVPHRVTISKGFFLQTTEVTQAQWKAVMGPGKIPWFYKRCGEDCPVERVTHPLVMEFIRKLNLYEKTTLYRLPTEAEWEYAARAENTSPYCCGADSDTLDLVAWYESNSDFQTHPVAQKEANGWGLFDIHGNVAEMCRDFYGTYPEQPTVDPMGPEEGTRIVYRGGGWNNSPDFLRFAFRGKIPLTEKRKNIGFRVAVTSP